MTKGQLHIENYFSSKVAWTDLDMDLQLIENHCYKLMSENKGRNFSNRDGWQSNDLIFPNILDNTAQTIVNAAATYFKELKGKKDYDTILQNMWININKPQGYNISHSHPQSDLSAVLWINSPEKSGKLCFNSPNVFSQHKTIEKCRENVKESLNYYHDFWIEPSEGKMIVFPSDLIHLVDVNESEEDRISISFNITLI